MSEHAPLFCPGHTALKKPWRFKIAGFLSLLLSGWYGLMTVVAQPTNTLQDQIADVTIEMDKAIEQVQKIVNQPVTRLVRSPGMEVATYRPGWFHEGASKPDFNNVDIRTTQEKNYDQHDYVTSDLNPGVVFNGRELEFNFNTKYFYTDYSVPKKKLTEPEMLEINRLYRIIGRCEQQLARLQTPKVAPATAQETTTDAILTRFPILQSNFVRVTLAVLVLLAIVYLFRKRSP